MTTGPIEVLHYTDPACPWAYSAEPYLRALEWRYGDGLSWRHVMIGLTEDWRQYEGRGYTTVGQAEGYARFRRRFGMAYAPHPRSRLQSSGRACRAVVAARAQGPELADALLRALRFAWFTTTLLMDEDAAIRQVAEGVEGLDAEAVMGVLDAPATEEAYQRDRAEARDRAGAGDRPGQDRAHRRPGALHGPEPRLPPGGADARRRRLAAARGLRPLRRQPRARRSVGARRPPPRSCCRPSRAG